MDDMVRFPPRRKSGGELSRSIPQTTNHKPQNKMGDDKIKVTANRDFMLGNDNVKRGETISVSKINADNLVGRQICAAGSKPDIPAPKKGEGGKAGK